MSFRFYIVEEPWIGMTKLILVESNGDERHAISLRPDGNYKRERLFENVAQEPEPFMKLSSDLARHLFPPLIEALAKKGFERPSESKLAGLYEAQSAHLKDLQTLIASHVLRRPRA